MTAIHHRILANRLLTLIEGSRIGLSTEAPGDVLLPQPFTINRGTGLKWIAALRSSQFECEPSQLGFEHDGKRYRNPEGVLCEVVRAPQTTGWDGVTILFDGEQFCASARTMLAAKVRGSLPDFQTFEEAALTIEAVLNSRAEGAE